MYIEICNIVKIAGVLDEAIRLSLFSFSLAGEAKKWLHSFKGNSLETWEQVVEKEREKRKEKASDKGMEVPYPVVQSKKDKDRHLARFLDIFRKLEITMPFGEAL